ncbi:hypothetical protein ACLOJK_035025 [Asimina triloba]
MAAWIFDRAEVRLEDAIWVLLWISVLAIWIIDGSARSVDGGLGVIDQRAIGAAGRHGYRHLHWSELEGGCCLLSTGCRPPSVE